MPALDDEMSRSGKWTYRTSGEIKYINSLDLKSLEEYIKSLEPGVRKWDADVDADLCYSWAQVKLAILQANGNTSPLHTREELRKWLEKEKSRWSIVRSLFRKHADLKLLAELSAHKDS